MRSEEITRLVSILRAVTTAVQFAPFIFVGFLIISVLLYLFVNDNVAAFVDLMFYISPIVAVYNLILSRILKLCKWHRLECLLPLLPIVIVFVNSFGFIIPDIAVYVNWSVNLIIFLLSLLNAYFVFIKK
jgi:hypothetical protein